MSGEFEDLLALGTSYQAMAKDSTNGAKAQNAEWFSTDLTRAGGPQFASKYRISLAINAEKVVQITLDSGSTWLKLNNATALLADCAYVFDIAVRAADAFNIRIPDSGGATVHYCRVDEVFSEA